MFAPLPTDRRVAPLSGLVLEPCRSRSLSEAPGPSGRPSPAWVCSLVPDPLDASWPLPALGEERLVSPGKDTVEGVVDSGCGEADADRRLCPCD